MGIFEFTGTRKECNFFEFVVKHQLPEHNLVRAKRCNKYTDYYLPESPDVAMKLGMLISACYEAQDKLKVRNHIKELLTKFKDKDVK